MDIEINDTKQQASFKNGKFYHTFTPSTTNQTVKLYHMGCVGDTRLNRIQLEQGTEPTGFVEPKNTTNTISGIFKNLRDLDVLMKDPESDFWTRIKKTAKGTIEEYHTSKLSNEIVKTAEGIIEKQTKVINTSVENKIIAETKKYSDELSSRITTLTNNTLRKDEISITNNGIQLGSGKVVDGRTISSILTTQPENIKAITDKFIITPANENLVLPEFRNIAKSNSRDTWLTPKINVNDITIGDEYIFIGEIYPEIGTTTPHNINFVLEYKSGQYGTNWITSRIINANGYSNERNYTLRVNVGLTDIEYIRLGIQQETSQNYKALDIYNAKIFKKKSAELIVDGSIEGRQIKAETLETGHHKAGSITSDIIASNAVKAKHIEIDDGLIDNLVSHNAFITKLWAQDAFIKSLQTVKISATQLDTDWLSAYTGEIGGFRIGHNPNDNAFWLTGSNNFECGINPGHNAGSRGAQLWAAWGDEWTKAGPNAWWVNAQGVMTCKNTPVFAKGMAVHGGVVHYANGTYTYSPNIKKIYMEQENGKTWIRYYVGSVGPEDDELAQYWNYVTMSGSDKRYKSNIKPTEVNGLEIINNLKCYDYDIKLPHEKEKHINCGIMAQDVEMHMNEAHLVYPNGIQSYTPFEMMPYLIKAVQELSTQNNELQQRIIKLEELING